MIFCLICNKWLPYCLCHRDELDFGRTEQRAFEFVYGKQGYEEAVRSYKEGLERNSNPQPKEPVFTPEDAIYAHSLGVLL